MVIEDRRIQITVVCPFMAVFVQLSHSNHLSGVR